MSSRNLFVLALVVSALLLVSCGGLAVGTVSPPISTGTPASGNSDQAEGTPALDLTVVLSETQGSVEVRGTDQADFSLAADGTLLQVQSHVRTGANGRVRLDLSNGTLVRAAPETVFTLQTNEVQNGNLFTRLVLEAGQVWVILNGGRLEVVTPSGKASVVGSYMSVWVDPLTGDVWVTCLEGWCQTENPTAVLDLVAGEGAYLYHWDPAGTIPPLPPQLRYLSQLDIDLFMTNNPEAQQVRDSMNATASALPPLVPTFTPTPLGSCFDLIQPPNDAVFPIDGLIQFDWNDQPGVYKYILSITKPDGAERSEIAWGSSVQIITSELPLAGSYQWTVTAFDSYLRPICTTALWTFTKSFVSIPTPLADCFTLASPANGSTLPETGPVTFTWGEQPGRYKFILTLIKPSGEEVSLVSWANNFTKELGLLRDAGVYKWKVTAYDSSIRPICSAGPWTFTKPGPAEPTPTDTPVPDSCVTLLTPANGTNFPGSARVDFSWSAYPGAYKYIISFKPPSTPAVTFLAWTPLHTRYVESFLEGGTYQWWVTVKDDALKDICTSQSSTFTKPETLIPTKTPGLDSGLFSNQNGPKGAQSSCGSLNFSVKTSNPMGGMIKLIYSSHASPDGNVDSHLVIGNNGALSGSGNLSLSNNGQTVYWRFAIYDGVYTHDPNIYSFTCPSSGSGGGGGGAQFWNQSGPTGAQSSCDSLNFSVSTSLTGMIKLVYNTTGTTPTGSDPHIVIGNGPGDGSGSLSDLKGYSGTVNWNFAVYGSDYIFDTSPKSFTCP